MIALRTRRLLFGCVVSNAIVGIAGLIALPAATTTVNTASVAAPAIAPTTSSTIATTGATNTTAPANTPSSQVSSAPRTRAHTPTTAAAAAGDVTGITSSAAPSTAKVRISPSAGNYPVSFSGTSSVSGRAQSVPSTGSIHLAKSGNDVTQTSPDAPGDVVLQQRFSANEADLISMQLTAGDNTKTFNMPNGVTYFLFNSPAGTSWTWHANSTDGKTAVTATGTINGSEAIIVNGVSVPVVKITTDITTSGDIKGTAELITWVSPELRLPVRQRQIINAKATKGFVSTTLSSDVTTTLTRLSPG